MSGTSMDGVDAALVCFPSNGKAQLIDHSHHPYPATLRHSLERIITPDWTGSLNEIAALDYDVGRSFAAAAKALIQDNRNIKVAGIGAHGQTIYHAPTSRRPTSWQLGDGNLIAELTGITVVTDFRRRDMACGGQGAPLVPAFHQYLLGESSAVLLNLGGIANITVLSQKGTNIAGFDTGPANTLLDNWIRHHRQVDFDKNGDWSREGRIHIGLLGLMLTDSFFGAAPPKSTGREHFNLRWLKNILERLGEPVPPVDVQSTLVELTAVSVSDAIKSYASHLDTRLVMVCGGGARNPHIVKRLQHHLSNYLIEPTDDHGIDADALEAMAFAWLAKQRLEQKPGNVPSVTGAAGKRVLGAVYNP